MLCLRPFLIAVLLLTALHEQSAASEPSYYDSLRLVSAMREDELMLLAARSAKSRRNEIGAQDFECLDRLEYPEVTDIPATQISNRLTAAEVQDALNYFQSAGGRRFVQRTELALSGKLPLDAHGFSTAEQAELEKFKQRPAGRKLLREFITKNAILMSEVMARVDRHLDDCAYFRQADAERQMPQKYCQSRPIASLDNVCLATYVAEGKAGTARRASVETNCRHDGRVLTSQIGLAYPEWPIALRWSKARELEILVDDDRFRIVSSAVPADSSQRFRVASRQPTDPPALECLPVTQGRPTLAAVLPLSVTIAAWRTYRRPGLCLMTARVPKEDVPGADGDMLLQFRRQKPAVLPFATTRLALIVQIAQLKNERPLLVDSGQSRLAMIGHAPQQTHMLTGKAADALLQSLKSKPAELTVQPEGASSYSIPVRRQDFDFAYADFVECLADLDAPGART